jgi:hypothetical protein
MNRPSLPQVLRMTPLPAVVCVRETEDGVDVVVSTKGRVSSRSACSAACAPFHPPRVWYAGPQTNPRKGDGSWMPSFKQWCGATRRRICC